MKNFMIGQFDCFDYKKFNRDYREDFYGIEACMLKTDYDVDCLIHEADKKKFSIGIHFPLRAGQWRLRDAQFMAQSEEERNIAFKYIEKELEYIKAKDLKPKYILFHYPKPVIIDEKVDWKLWRFADDSEYAFQNRYSFDEFAKRSEFLFEWLSQKSEEYDFIPVLELDAVNKYIYKEDFLQELLKKYNKIKLCLDIGRLHFQDKIDSAFDSMEIVGRYAKYAEILHLWNAKVKGKLENNHYPVLPSLKPEDGWAPMEEYLRIIKNENPNVKVLFEHRSDLISDEELQECYNWIDGLLR